MRWVCKLQFALALLVLLAAAIPRLAAAAPPKAYRISGIAVSARDGLRIARCRITAAAVVPSATSVQTGMGRGVGDGAPQSGNSNRAQPIETTADATGRFTLDLPHGGSWRLTASARGFRSQGYDEHDGFYQAVVLSDAEPTYSLTFKLAPDAAIAGAVFDESGEPIESAQVVAELVPPPVPDGANVAQRPRQTGFAQTDDLGHYELANLAPGRYRVRVQAQVWYAQGRGFPVQPQNGATDTPSPDPSLDVIYAPTWYPGTDDDAAAEIIKLGDGELREADFHLTPLPSVHLKIPRTEVPAQPQQDGNGRNRPQNQQMPTITRVSGEQMGMNQMMGGGGSFGGQQPSDWDFGGLTPGRYEIRIPGPNGRDDATVKEIEVRAGGGTVLTMDQAKPLIPVTVTIAAEHNPVVEFIDMETARIINAQPPHGARGDRDRDGQEPEVLKDATPSTQRTVMLEAHPYEVYLTGGSGTYITSITAEGAKIEGRRVTISGPVNLTINTGARRGDIAGIATMDGKPLAGGMVLLVPATFGLPGDLRSVTRDEANSDGSFTLQRVIPGQYIMVAIDHGWDVEWRNLATLAKYLVKGVPIDLPESGKLKVTVPGVQP